MNLTTADRYFQLFPESISAASKPAEVFKVNMRIAAVSSAVQRFLCRGIAVEDHEDKFTPEAGSGTNQVRLYAFPVSGVESVSVYNEVLPTDEYEVNETDGVISFIDTVRRILPNYLSKIVVSYTGGMADSTADFISKYPDIEMEVLMQVNFEIKRAGDIAMKSVANGQTSSQLNPYGFQDSLIAVLDRYRVIRC